jgi:hypothetical protein
MDGGGCRGLIFMYKNVLWCQEKDEGEGGRKMNGEEEEGKEEREQELQLLYAVVTALGLAWPSNRETQVGYHATELTHFILTHRHSIYFPQ